MTTRERLVLYSLLMTLIVININYVLGSPGNPGNSGSAAYAEPMREGDILGPADGVVLAGKDKDLTLANKDGHLAWGDEPYQRAHGVAFVHIAKILNRQLAADAFEDEREAFRQEAQEKEQEFTDELNTLNEQIQELAPDDADRQMMIQQGNNLYQQYQQWMQQVSLKQDAIAAKHLEEAYRELVTAVNIVSDRMSIDLVYRFIPIDNPFRAQSMELATMAIRLRPALRYPPGLDITLEVMEELSLDYE